MRLTIKLGGIEVGAEVLDAGDHDDVERALDGAGDELLRRIESGEPIPTGPVDPGAGRAPEGLEGFEKVHRPRPEGLDDVLPSLASLALRVVRLEERLDEKIEDEIDDALDAQVVEELRSLIPRVNAVSGIAQDANRGMHNLRERVDELEKVSARRDREDEAAESFVQEEYLERLEDLEKWKGKAAPRIFRRLEELKGEVERKYRELGGARVGMEADLRAELRGLTGRLEQLEKKQAWAEVERIRDEVEERAGDGIELVRAANQRTLDSLRPEGGLQPTSLNHADFEALRHLVLEAMREVVS